MARGPARHRRLVEVEHVGGEVLERAVLVALQRAYGIRPLGGRSGEPLEACVAGRQRRQAPRRPVARGPGQHVELHRLDAQRLVLEHARQVGLVLDSLEAGDRRVLQERRRRHQHIVLEREP